MSLLPFLQREESFRVKDKLENGDVKLGLIDRKANGSRKVMDDHYEQIKEKLGVIVNGFPGYGSVPKALEGELVTAGWPSWLAAVAGEAINGWIPRKADTFEKLDKAIIKKRPSRNTNVQNFWLYVFGMVFNAFAIMTQDCDAVMKDQAAFRMIGMKGLAPLKR